MLERGSWAKPLAFTVHRGPPLHKPRTSKTEPTHKAWHWLIPRHLLGHIHVVTVSFCTCCQRLSRGEKHLPVFICLPLHETISREWHINETHWCYGCHTEIAGVMNWMRSHIHIVCVDIKVENQKSEVEVREKAVKVMRIKSLVLFVFVTCA